MTASLDLAVVGNSVLAALLDRTGRYVWCCFPRFDGDPVFCSLLDGSNEPRGGFFDITLERLAGSTQRYVGNTAIVETVLTDGDGASVRITDFAPRFRRAGRMYRPMMLMRRVEPLMGRPRIRVRLRPRFNNGAIKPAMTVGSNHLRYVAGEQVVRLSTDAAVSYVAEEEPFVLAGPVHFVLGPDEGPTQSIAALVREFHDETADYWVEWARYLSVPFEWQEAVIRAAITLKLCSFEETGAIVAALTTSIPEAPHSGRNWDYRYCWLRDAYFVVHALNRLGATRTMEEFIIFITNVAALDPGGRLKPVYGILASRDLAEREVTTLTGYRGMGPVRVGNLAHVQVQNDSYGSVVLAAAQMFFDRRLARQGDLELFRQLEALGAKAAELGLTPDAGLWEFRGRARVHTHSAVMCWAACRRLAKIAQRLELQDRAAHWYAEADRLRSAIIERAWNAQLNSFVASFGGEDIDASLLLLQEVGFLSASDPRFLGTLAQVEQRLRRGDHLLRYDTPDDFGLPHTSFTVCTFWYIDALAVVGRRDEARALFERVLAARNHVGLLSEDVDPATGELWGNFPQTYSLVGLIICAMRLSRTWEEAFWRDS
ncbi:MAG: glycoside hydrolase family 15 protein [Alphaproteobacteria bacterium]|nr:glycoside hydrolase family 15 protein [Alphaproteobacteria bacterium]